MQDIVERVPAGHFVAQSSERALQAEPSPCGGLPLGVAPTCTPLRVEICTGKDDVRAQLGRLGLVPGCEIQVVNEAHGNIIVDIKGTRVALNNKLANRVRVTPL